MSVLSFSLTQQLYYGNHTMEEFKKIKWTKDIVMSKTPVLVGWMDNGIYSSKIFNLTPLMAMVLSTNVWQKYFYYSVDLPSINKIGNVLRKGSTFPNVIKENKNLILKVINTKPLLFGIFDGKKQINSFIPKTLTEPFFAGPFETNPYQMSDQDAYKKIKYFINLYKGSNYLDILMDISVTENNIERTALYWASRNVKDEMSYKIFEIILDWSSIKIMLTKTHKKFVIQWFDKQNEWQNKAQLRYLKELYYLHKHTNYWKNLSLNEKDRNFLEQKIKIYEKMKKNDKEYIESTLNPLFGQELNLPKKPKLKF